MNDWREPFKILRNELLQIYNTCPEMYHAIVLSVFRNKSELNLSLDNLEPKLLGHKPFQNISIKSEGCEFHSHRFYGSNNSPYYALQTALNGIEEWCDHIPGGMVPSLEIPKLSSQADRNLIRWMSMVYYLASVSKAPYLEIEVEYQENANIIGFFPWYECPHPHGWSPFDWLICKGTAIKEIPRWKDRFEKSENELPDYLDTYLLDGVIRSSIAAIDILTCILPMERRASKVSEQVTSKSKTIAKNSSRKRQKQIVSLSMYLRSYHDLDQTWNDTTGTVTKKTPFSRLNAKQWAAILEWEHKGGGPADSTVRRVMEDIFGKNPMKKYQRFLDMDDRNRSLLDFIDKMLILKGGSFYGQISEENSSKSNRELPIDPSKIEYIQQGTNQTRKSDYIKTLKQKEEKN
ncbi:hypothetical protein [Rubinisphaera italica]|uniref:Uncharacterized protein n=1 Tax=Rubinisphaera italica TaxID=2527969 RepID=A0A5C5XDW3_9PLAN|nr:hypothetical protein [Rubinisphaera italica]TWT60839.1 hypothetical protein Pan54_15660 [Rubinisphaera italica]